MAQTISIARLAAGATLLCACGSSPGDHVGPVDSGPPTVDSGPPIVDSGIAVADAASEAGEAPETGGPPMEAGPATCAQTDGGAPVLIASGQMNPTGVAVDGKSVYWANSGGGTIVKCALSGCGGSPPSVLAKAQSRPFVVLVDPRAVYWTDLNAGIQQCPLDGCGSSPPLVFAPGQTSASGLAIDATNVYWTESMTGLVASCPLAGCAKPSILYAGPLGPAYGVLVDSTNIYWVNVANGTVDRAPLGGLPDGGAPVRIATGNGDETYAALGSDRIYWTESGDPGWVLSAPLTGESDGGIGDILASGLSHPMSILVDRTCGTIYWATRGVAGSGSTDTGSAVYRCPASGCNGNPELFAGGQNGTIFVTQDSDTIYWANFDDGTVWKSHK